MNGTAKISNKKRKKTSDTMEGLKKHNSGTSDKTADANVITLSSSEEISVEKPAKRQYNKKSYKSQENPTTKRPLRANRYTGTYKAKDWYKGCQKIQKNNVKLKNRLAELEKLRSQNKDTGIILDYDENEAKKFFDALGIRRIYPSHIRH